MIAPGKPELTTQLFFPDEPANASDTIYEPALLLQNYKVTGKTAYGTFEFVVGP